MKYIAIIAFFISMSFQTLHADQINIAWDPPQGPPATMEYISQNNIQLHYQLFRKIGKNSSFNLAEPIWDGVGLEYVDSQTTPAEYRYSVRAYLDRIEDGKRIYSILSNTEGYIVQDAPQQPPDMIDAPSLIIKAMELLQDALDSLQQPK